jgi:hypothetical protein
MNGPEVYNEKKNITFSLYNTKGLNSALAYLASVKSQMGRAWYGLIAELRFYDRYKREYGLDPLLDYGIHADFGGCVKGCNRCRIDVTTNVDFKRLSTYEPIMAVDYDRVYKIAVVDYKTGELLDMVDLNFPIDPRNGGRLFDIALFMPADINSHGDSRYNYYQRIVTVNNVLPDTNFKLVQDLTDWYIPDIHTEMQNMWDAYEDDDSFDFRKELDKELATTAQFLKKVTERNIVACAQRKYEVLTPDGDGDFVTQIYWKHPIIKDLLVDKIDIDISEEL